MIKCSIKFNASTICQRSNDRKKVSKRLTEEAEKYFEDFISNVEDTDISSFDGERSDASSTLGVTKARDAVSHSRETETMYNTSGSNSLPVEMDGVILPWLQWETANDGSPLPSKNKRELPVTPKSILWDATQVEESKFVFEAKIIQRMELLVLSTLQWKMNPVTPLSFVDHIVRRFGFETDLHLEFLWRCIDNC
ncbi:hypothetical protein CsSME_00012043 [Camellia sinensis var. sinensis]